MFFLINFSLFYTNLKDKWLPIFIPFLIIMLLFILIALIKKNK